MIYIAYSHTTQNALMHSPDPEVGAKCAAEFALPATDIEVLACDNERDDKDFSRMWNSPLWRARPFAAIATSVRNSE
jgi:hypothetical protein